MIMMKWQKLKKENGNDGNSCRNGMMNMKDSKALWINCHHLLLLSSDRLHELHCYFVNLLSTSNSTTTLCTVNYWQSKNFFFLGGKNKKWIGKLPEIEWVALGCEAAGYFAVCRRNGDVPRHLCFQSPFKTFF